MPSPLLSNKQSFRPGSWAFSTQEQKQSNQHTVPLQHSRLFLKNLFSIKQPLMGYRLRQQWSQPLPHCIPLLNQPFQHMAFLLAVLQLRQLQPEPQPLSQQQISIASLSGPLPCMGCLQPQQWQPHSILLTQSAKPLVLLYQFRKHLLLQYQQQCLVLMEQPRHILPQCIQPEAQHKEANCWEPQVCRLLLTHQGWHPSVQEQQ